MPCIMRRYLFYMGYCGTRLRGVQKQCEAQEETVSSVAGCLEKGLERLKPDYLGRVTFSSRTDKGVHAVCNTAHVDLSIQNGYYEPAYITHRLNSFLIRSDADIRIHKTVIVPPEFHARHSATHRSYVYRLAVIPHQTSYEAERERFLPAAEFKKLYLISPPFDVERVLPVCQLLEGTHDFATFAAVAKRSSPVPTTRSISRLSVTPGRPLLDPKYDPLYERLQLWDVTVSASSFLYKQVRKIVGVLVGVGQGRLDISDVQYMLDHPAASNYHKHATLAPAGGLFLLNVHYPPESLVVGAEYESTKNNLVSESSSEPEISSNLTDDSLNLENNFNSKNSSNPDSLSLCPDHSKDSET